MEIPIPSNAMNSLWQRPRQAGPSYCGDICGERRLLSPMISLDNLGGHAWPIPASARLPVEVKRHRLKIALFSPAMREPKDAQNGGKIPGPHGLSQHCVDAGGGGGMARRPGHVQPNR